MSTTVLANEPLLTPDTISPSTIVNNTETITLTNSEIETYNIYY